MPLVLSYTSIGLLVLFISPSSLDDELRIGLSILFLLFAQEA
jgi:hypothetical protein